RVDGRRRGLHAPAQIGARAARVFGREYPAKQYELPGNEQGDDADRQRLPRIKRPALGRRLVYDLKHQSDGAQLDLVAAGQPLLGDTLAIDVHAVGAVEVADVVAVGAPFDGGVAVADAGLG